MEDSAVVYISILTFAAMFFGVLGAAGVMDIVRDRRELRARVGGATPGETGIGRQDSDKTGLDWVREQVLGVLKKLGEANRDRDKKDAIGQGSPLAQRLAAAGYRREAAPQIFAGIKVVMAIVVPVVTWILPIEALDKAPLFQALGGNLLAAGAGLYGPELILQRVSDARKLRIVHGFPDALDLLVVCIEAGLGLDAAISRTGQELNLAHPDLCEELHMVSLELRAGLPRAQALQNFAWRTDIPEVKSLVALLIQTDRFGTSVGQALRVHSDAMRVQRMQKAEEQAGKLPVKLLFPLMLFIFPVIFIVILGSAIIQARNLLLPTMRGER